MAKFKCGNTYRLRKKYNNQFIRTGRVFQEYGDGVFTFTVGEIDDDGDVWCTNRVYVTGQDERYMFKRVDNK